MDNIKLVLANHIQHYRSEIQELVDVLQSMLNLETAATQAVMHLESCKGLDVKYHTDKARKILNRIEKEYNITAS